MLIGAQLLHQSAARLAWGRVETGAAGTHVGQMLVLNVQIYE